MSKKPRKMGRRLQLEVLRMLGAEVDPDAADMYVDQRCESCGAHGDGLGIEHAAECLVPLAQAVDALDE